MSFTRVWAGVWHARLGGRTPNGVGGAMMCGGRVGKGWVGGDVGVVVVEAKNDDLRARQCGCKKGRCASEHAHIFYM